MNLVWNSDNKLKKYVSKLMDKVIRFEEKVNDLLEKQEQIKEQIALISNSPIQVFSDCIGTIQSYVDDLSLNDYSNLTFWVDDLDKSLEGILRHRLGELIGEWTKEFEHWSEDEAKMIEVHTVHEIKIKD